MCVVCGLLLCVVWFAVGCCLGFGTRLLFVRCYCVLFVDVCLLLLGVYCLLIGARC